MPKRELLPIEQLSSESRKLYDLVNSETDLAVIVVSASFLDACLGSIINKKLIESSVSMKLLNPQGGAIGSYSARADFCYALGLIEKTLYQDLIKIAEIRNEIAHYHLALSFDSEPIQKMCGDLSYLRSLKNGNTETPLGVWELLVRARDQFVVTAVMISNRLLITGLGIKCET